jgi:hypothetical protein
MKAALLPLALNELLDRPLIVSFNCASVFPIRAAQDLILLLREACLTPELTGRAHNGNRFKLTIRNMLIRAPVE